VIGVGNQFRHDDGAGPAVIERLRGQLPGEVELVVTDGDAVRLIEAWSGASLAVVVDAVRADPPVPGRLHRFIVGPDPHGGTRPGHGGTGPGHGGGTRPGRGGPGPGGGRTPTGGDRTGPGSAETMPRTSRPGPGSAETMPRTARPGPGSAETMPRTGWAGSTHTLGLSEAVGLGMALDRMPQRLVVHAIEAADLTVGTGMTPAVATAVDGAAAAVRHDILGPGPKLNRADPNLDKTCPNPTKTVSSAPDRPQLMTHDGP
jgi:Ni,Fe-hydrogenase maturation factor